MAAGQLRCVPTLHDPAPACSAVTPLFSVSPSAGGVCRCASPEAKSLAMTIGLHRCMSCSQAGGRYFYLDADAFRDKELLSKLSPPEPLPLK